jgi:hypothetical protein
MEPPKTTPPPPSPIWEGGSEPDVLWGLSGIDALISPKPYVWPGHGGPAADTQGETAPVATSSALLTSTKEMNPYV